MELISWKVVDLMTGTNLGQEGGLRCQERKTWFWIWGWGGFDVIDADRLGGGNMKSVGKEKNVNNEFLFTFGLLNCLVSNWFIFCPSWPEATSKWCPSQNTRLRPENGSRPQMSPVKRKCKEWVMYQHYFTHKYKPHGRKKRNVLWFGMYWIISFIKYGLSLLDGIGISRKTWKLATKLIPRAPRHPSQSESVFNRFSKICFCPDFKFISAVIVFLFRLHSKQHLLAMTRIKICHLLIPATWTIKSKKRLNGNFFIHGSWEGWGMVQIAI